MSILSSVVAFEGNPQIITTDNRQHLLLLHILLMNTVAHKNKLMSPVTEGFEQ